MSSPCLGLEALRSLIALTETGTLGRAGDRVGRTPSALSQQITRLEEQLGVMLVRRTGRTLVLTDAGVVLERYARRLLALNDEAVTAVSGFTLAGTVRVGLAADFSENWLPSLLGRFARAHPGVHLEAATGRTRELLARLDAGTLDLALCYGPTAERPHTEVLITAPLRWIGPEGWQPPEDGGLPLCLFDAPCQFREAALAAAENAGLRWRIAYTSPGLAGLWAGVRAGLGLTVRTAEACPPDLTVLDAALLPPLPMLPLSLCLGGRVATPAVESFRSVLREAVGASAPFASRQVTPAFPAPYPGTAPPGP